MKKFGVACLRQLGFVGALLIANHQVEAVIIGSSAPNGDGTFMYSYTIDNSQGSFAIQSWSLNFNFPTPDWNQLDVFSGGDVVVPDPIWEAAPGVPVSGQSAQEFFTFDAGPGIPPATVDIGQMLSGFSFVSSIPPGTVGYHEFSETGDFSDSGSTIGPEIASTAVPEMGGGLEGIALMGLTAFGASIRQRTR